MIVLGLCAYRPNSAACLVLDGKVVAAVRESALRRIPGWSGLPTEAIAFCLDQAGVTLSDVDVIARNEDRGAHMFERLAFLAKDRPHLTSVASRLNQRRSEESLRTRLDAAFPDMRFRGQIRSVEHQTSQLATAYFTSPFNEAVMVSIDGFGDFTSTAWGTALGPDLSIEKRVYFPHSLWLLFEAGCRHLGFAGVSGIRQMMTVALSGTPNLQEEVSALITLKPNGEFRLTKPLFRHVSLGSAGDWRGEETEPLLSPDAEDLFGEPRTPTEPLTEHHRNLAASFQSVYEGAVLALLDAARLSSGLTKLAITGAGTRNTLAMGRVPHNTAFSEVYAFPARGGYACTVGAALFVSQQNGAPTLRSDALPHWGPGFSGADIEAAILRRESELHAAGLSWERVDDEGELIAKAVSALGEGSLAWFQGGLDWGTESICNRVILEDATRPSETRRTAKGSSDSGFRQMLILDQLKDAWFEASSQVPAFQFAWRLRPNSADALTAISENDDVLEVDSVADDQAPRMAALLRELYAARGVPGAIKTNFTDRNGLVVTPKQAIDAFLISDARALMIGNWCIQR